VRKIRCGACFHTVTFDALNPLVLTTGTGDEQFIYQYYSPALLHSDTTRATMALPDLQQIPSRF
jgi:hypothetical protein